MSEGRNKFIDMLYGLSFTAVTLFAIAIIVYIVVTMFGKSGESIGFELGTISAVIGGFILASGFFSKASPDLQLKMKRTGVSYLVASISFVVFGICFPIVQVEALSVGSILYSLVIWVSAVSICVGAVSFSIGTVLLAFLIPKLWRE